MSLLNKIIYDLITGKGKRTSNYQYNILETTPFLHGAETLNTLYDNASTPEQKASVLLHIENFHDLTSGIEDYQDLRNKMWDDFR